MLTAASTERCTPDQHTEYIDLDLHTSSGALTERVRITMEIQDETSPECAQSLGEFTMDYEVYIGDGTSMLSMDAWADQVFYYGSLMYFYVVFNSPIDPSTTDLTSMTVEQGGVEKCSTDCLTDVAFHCESCDSGAASPGASMNFTIQMTADVFGDSGDTVLTNLALEFSFTYERRSLMEATVSHKVPISVMMRDYDCHGPTGLVGDVNVADCMLFGLTKSSYCTREGVWDQPQSCPMESAGPVLVSISLLAIAVFALRGICKSKHSQWTPVMNEETQC